MTHKFMFISALVIALAGCDRAHPVSSTQETGTVVQSTSSIDPVQATLQLIQKNKWDSFLDITSISVRDTNYTTWVVSVIDRQAEAKKETPWIHFFSVEKATGEITMIPID